jgi:uncharacterized protein (TIGR02453 family)
MTYFSPDFLAFFKELSENNHKEWFDANKARFKKNVEAPFLKFLAALIDKVSAVDSSIAITPKDAVFRIYRDVRFSQDKTPYKTHMAAIVSAGGRKGMHDSGVYIQAGHDEFSIYGGAYMPEKEGLKNLRGAIAADLTGFEKLLNAPDFLEKFGELHGEENKRIPEEFMEAAKKQPLLFKKSFYYFHKFEPEIILSDSLLETCMTYYLAGKPVGDFLAKAMKG